MHSDEGHYGCVVKCVLVSFKAWLMSLVKLENLEKKSAVTQRTYSIWKYDNVEFGCDIIS